MALTEKQIIANLKAGQFAPVYLLTGEENYYIDLLSDYFENNVVPEENRDFDQMVVYGADVDMLTVVTLAQQVPMLSPKKLVLVKEAQDIPKEQWEVLANYLESPSQLSILVFCYRHKALDKRSKAYKTIDKIGVVYEHKKLYDNQVPSWILAQVSAAGYEITERGALLLADSLGNNLSKISNELSKLYISTPKGATITEEIMERNIGISKDYNVFELQNAIGRRDVLQCNRIVNHFAANPKDNPIQMVLPQLYKYVVSTMIYIQSAGQMSEGELAKTIGCSPFFLKDYAVASRNFTLGKLASCIGYIHKTDLRSKGVHNAGTVTDGELLKELIFKMIH